MELLYQIELNNFTIGKYEIFCRVPEKVESLKNSLWDLITNRRMIVLYSQVMNKYDESLGILESMSQLGGKNMQRRASNVNFKALVIKEETIDIGEAKKFLAFRKIMQQISAEFKEFRITINTNNFRPLIMGYYMYFESALDKIKTNKQNNTAGLEDRLKNIDFA